MGYFGSKATTGLCQALLGLQPPHDLYIETHLGGGALMRRKAPAMRSIGIDRDQRALDGFRCDYPVELVQGCAHEFLASFPLRGTELVYSDPPYLHGPVGRTGGTATSIRMPTTQPFLICSRACRAR